MYLHTLEIKGFKRLLDVNIEFNEATFLIGQNNCGKSSLLKAIEHLLTDKHIPSDDFYSTRNQDTGNSDIAIETITMIAEFRDVSPQSSSWRGFKGRTYRYDIPDDKEESGISIIYKKEWTPAKSPTQYLKAYERVLKEEYKDIKKIEDLISLGINENLVIETFKKTEGTISKADKEKLDNIDELWDLTENEIFFKNPGGFSGNVLSKLPRYLLIPAESGESELSGKTGTLQSTLGELFKEVRDKSVNYEKAQTFLDNLAEELDPTDSDSDFGGMLKELNEVMSTVFPESKVHVNASLTNPDDVLKPSFIIEMESNIKTSVINQGTGMIRSAVFSILRFRKMWEEKRAQTSQRGLIICFEEPEIFLHPSAANQMRSTIYDLVSRNSQIISSTHSPYMIDLSRKPKQNLIRFTKNTEGSTTTNFSVSKAFKSLQAEDKTHVKMILKIDDYVARAFFTNRTILVEGDTEDIVIKETTRRLPQIEYSKVISNCEVIKGRGKPILISLIKYLKAVGIEPIVMHDADTGVEGAMVHNQPIREALNNDGNLIVLDRYLEDILGYSAPSSNKPYRAYVETQKWGEEYSDIPEKWRDIYQKLVNIESPS
jgi:putative ATP-dependent endonuclease of OLD family